MSEAAAQPMPSWGAADGQLGNPFSETTGSSVFFGATEDPRRVNPGMEIMQLGDFLEILKKKAEDPDSGLNATGAGSVDEYILQEVNRWNKRIQRYQDENRELVFKNEALAEDVEKARVDKLDIIDLLRHEDMKKKMELQRLGQELRDTTASKDARIAELEREMEDFKAGSEEKIEALTEQIKSVEDQLNELKQFEQEKSIMDKENRHLNEMIMREDIQHREQLRDLERKREIEIQQQKKHEEMAVAQKERDMLAIQDKHISEVTRQAIHDNAQLEMEKAYQNRETKQMVAQVEEFTQETMRLKRELSVQQDAEKELARKNCSYQKTIKALLTKIKKLEGANAQYLAEMDAFTQAGGAAGRASSAMGSTTSDFGSVAQETSSNVEELQAKLGALKKDARSGRAEVKRLRSKVAKMEGLMEEAARFIMGAGGGGAGGSGRPSSTGVVMRTGALPGIKGAESSSAAAAATRDHNSAVQLYIKIKSQLSV
jgi:hypothetical protein